MHPEEVKKIAGETSGGCQDLSNSVCVQIRTITTPIVLFPAPKYFHTGERTSVMFRKLMKHITSSASESSQCVTFPPFQFPFKHQNGSFTLADQNQPPVVAIPFISPPLM